MLFDVKMPDGTPPPMAAEALTADGKSAGYIAQGGRLLYVTWMLKRDAQDSLGKRAE